MDFVHSQNEVGCLNPVGREPSIQIGLYRGQVPTLVDIACQRIVRFVDWTRSAIDICPEAVLRPLLKAALVQGCDLVIPMLVHHWPYEVLHLRSVLSENLLPCISAYLYPDQLMDRVRMSLLQTTCLVSAFVSAVKKPDCEPGCRVLDLVGFTSAEAVIMYLTAHCKLLENQRSQALLIAQLTQRCADQGHPVPLSCLPPLNDDFRVPSRQYVVRLDACVRTKDLYEALLESLIISAAPTTPLCVEVDKLDLASLLDEQLINLLASVPANQLHGLSVSMCRFEDGRFAEFLTELIRFKELKCLRLSYLNIRGPPQNSAMGCAMVRLINLGRLDMSATLFRGKLKVVLGSLVVPLDYLNLSACCLRVDDYAFLGSAECGFRESLRDLILNDNTTNQVSSPVSAIAKCFQAGWPSLEVLLISGMDLGDSDLPRIVTALCRGAPQLRLLDLSSNPLESTVLGQCLQELASQLPRLSHIKVSPPKDCFDDGADGDYGMLDFERNVSFSKLVDDLRKRYSPHLQILFADWD